MNTSDFHEKSVPELLIQLKDLLRLQFDLRMQLKLQTLSDNSKIKKTRRLIARLKTVLREKV